MEFAITSNQTTAEFDFPCIGWFCDDKHLPPGSPALNAKSPTGFQAQFVLCSSVGTLCFLLFCFLRVRWDAIYSPRLRMKKHAPQRLPDTFFGWILPLLKTPNSVILEKVGLDAVVMLQFLLMGIKLFTFCGFFGTVVLYPISKMGGNFANGTNPEFPGNDTTNSTFGFPVFLTPAQQTTSFLWVYLFFTYFFCFATFYFTFLNYRDYVGIRREFLLRKAKTLSARTLLITGIPPKLRSDRKLAEYFENLGIGVVESVHTIRHVSRLMEYIKERVQYLRALERSYTDYLGNPCGDPMYDPDALAAEIDANMDVSAHEGLPTHSEERERPLVRSSFLVGPKVDAIDFYSNKFEHVNDVVLKARKVGKFLPTSVGFVTFEEAISAYVASQVLIDSTPFRLRAQLAPEPRDILWENISMHGRERVIRKGLILFILLFLVFSWTVPCFYLSALTSKESLTTYFPWLMKLAEKNKIINQIVAGFIPTLGVVIFFAFLPLIFNSLSIIEGFTTRSEAEESAFGKQFFFMLINILLFFTVSSAIFKSPQDIFEDPTKIANIFASKLPEIAPFFMNYAVLQGIMLCPIQMIQIGPLIIQLFYRLFLCKTPRDYAEVMAPRSYNYGWGYPVPVFMFVVVLVYSTIAPMILVLGAVYFCMAYLVLKYQLLYVYFHSYEVAGRMWPLVFSRIILGLLIFELTSAGLFILNKSYPLAGLCVPLIILTVGFKLVMDAAYQRSTQYLPLQLLSEKLGPVTTVVPPENSNEPTSSDPNSGNTNNKDRSNSIHPLNTDDIAKPPRRRRTVLDEDDYVADPRKNTDFREPPMTLVDGILNTGMKRYGHPAMVGVLPQLWLPIKAGAEKDRAISLRREDFSEGSSSSSITVPQPIRKRTDLGEREPLLNSYNIPINANTGGEEEEAGQTDEEEEADNTGTYYHHPERRLSKSLSRSYGATSTTQ